MMRLGRIGGKAMTGCRKVRGLIAASCYEALNESQQQTLDRHLARCAACRAAAQDLRALVACIPPESVAFEGDLLPALRAELAARPLRAWTAGRKALRFLAPVAAMALLVAAVGYTAYGPGGLLARPAPVVVVASPVEKALVEAHHLAKRDFPGAVSVLHEALAAHGDDLRAGQAQLFLADLEFDHGQRYAEAYAAYETLRNRYWDTWSQSPRCVDRFNLLDEARTRDFEPLYALDAAINGSGDVLAQLETIVASNPATLLADRAVTAMCQAAGGVRVLDGATKAAALEQVRDSCTNPTVIAQLNLMLGNTYWKDLNDADRARPLYTEVAENDDAVLARAAQQCLSELDGSDAGDVAPGAP